MTQLGRACIRHLTSSNDMTLKIWVTSHSRSLKIASFDIAVSHSYYGPVFCLFRDKARYLLKIAIFHTPHTFDTHVMAISSDSIVIIFSFEKLGQWSSGATRRWKKFENMLSHFQTTNVTDRQTDRRTPRHVSWVVTIHRVASRGNKTHVDVCFLFVSFNCLFLFFYFSATINSWLG